MKYELQLLSVIRGCKHKEMKLTYETLKRLIRGFIQKFPD